MKNLRSVFVIISAVLFFTACEKNSEDDIIQLTMSSWRMEDQAQMNRINNLFSETYPNINIQFTPVDPSDYDEHTLNNIALKMELTYISSAHMIKGESFMMPTICTI